MPFQKVICKCGVFAPRSIHKLVRVKSLQVALRSVITQNQRYRHRVLVFIQIPQCEGSSHLLTFSNSGRVLYNWASREDIGYTPDAPAKVTFGTAVEEESFGVDGRE